MKNLLNLAYLLILALFFSCSTDEVKIVDELPEQDYESLIQVDDIDYALTSINTVNLTVTGTFSQNKPNDIVRYAILLNEKSNIDVNADDNQSLTINENGLDYTATVNHLDKSKTYYLRTYVLTLSGTDYYGEEEVISFPSTIEEDQRSVTFSNVAIGEDGNGIKWTDYVRIAISASTEFIGERPAEVGVEYSINKDFSSSMKTINTDALGASLFMFIIQLSPGTKYYARIYAEYADGEVINSEVIEETTTVPPRVGLFYPLTVSEFGGLGGYTSSSFVIYKIDELNKKIYLILKGNTGSTQDWVAGDLQIGIFGKSYEARRPTVAELQYVHQLWSTDIYFASAFSTFSDEYYRTSDVDPNNSANIKEYNPITGTERFAPKVPSSAKLHLERYVKVISY
ncbi:hypothetical protein [Flammeovirga kamogawensis]|uniref:DUF4959 domain-containing protein n=1 Tax=Flammeovirga kamogawensis TaxID=373891 RepID=A0ABX8GW24_9BACT|nr:hypothetical protein [Flammeovirga kamogawensis]MBB6461241.1 hypothetical protein [Flammeovirga kamogawensis]QWG07800.1 hypothetical protein KM029_02345 [Flammeovirga kamogawensis]TRX69606.1 hypothetical protein EO216_16280 [Flammeovirga kamogawensis]